MLKLKNISKSYKGFKALDNINLSFSENEFVAILGPSGSGKTTLLNIIGGLDMYDLGDLIINGKSTKEFKTSQWDAYRNNSIGFIFQNYNLINHISILDNVAMSLTLSGVSSSERKKKAKELLDRVGLSSHINKKPNQLSGGQMQRVAIARALANDPDIILADEPTGALDSASSKQIMDLIKEISKDKLVILVTHNSDLASKYASRIIKLEDGKVTHDTSCKRAESNKEFKLKKTSMSFLTALKLSFNNIKTKLGRTSLTAFASSIGIIGIAFILAVSNGLNAQITEFEENSLASSPIVISNQAINLDSSTLESLGYGNSDLEKYTKEEVIYSSDTVSNLLHTNNITEDYVEYIESIDKDYIDGVVYQTGASINAVIENDGSYSVFDVPSAVLGESTQIWTILPTSFSEEGVIEKNYDVLAGSLDNNEPGLILQVDNKNQISSSILESLGFDDSVSFKQIMDKEIKIVLNDDWYEYINGSYVQNTDLESLYNSDNSITVKIVAIVRGKEGKEVATNTSGLGYTQGLVDMVIEGNSSSEIVQDQEEADYNILTHENFSDIETKETMLGYLGADIVPTSIYIYPKDFDTKDYIIDYLDNYNEDKDEEDIIEYTDMSEMISSLTGSIMDAITIVLVAFSSISLVVSSIMIGIITYVSVLERTSEIGILRSLGARKKDIRRVFNAETLLTGLFSGVLGIVIAYLLTIPANVIIENLTTLKGVASLNPMHAFILLIINVLLTVIGGSVPATIASNKSPVEALRTD